MSRVRLCAIIFLLIGIAIILHQAISYGKFWEWNDALHHEWFAALSITFGLGILVGEKLKG